MSKVGDVISSLLVKEEQHKLNDVRIDGIPFWPLFKHDIRRKYIIENGIVEKLVSSKNKLSVFQSPLGILQSFWQFHKILLHPHPVDNLFMGFSRLDKVHGLYMDKFVDPIVEEANLYNNYIYFEYGRVGKHKKPRMNSEHICYTDYIYMVSTLWSLIVSPVYVLKHYNDFVSFQSKIKEVFNLKINLLYLSRKATEFKLLCSIYSCILARLKVKRVFGVSRIVFIHTAFAAKKRGLKVYELQHGITLGPTDLYSGIYLPEIDPDLFLTFGKSCPLNVFGVPEDRIKNIGWAFNKYIQRISHHAEGNAILVVSEPQITNEIIQAVIMMAKMFPEKEFHIRRHPTETFTVSQEETIKSYNNVKDTTSEENSFAVLMSYKYVLGENCSVLYEALSLGKKVARFSFCGLHPSLRAQDDGFFYLDSPSDLQIFIESQNIPLNQEVYSEFSKLDFMSLLN